MRKSVAILVTCLVHTWSIAIVSAAMDKRSFLLLTSGTLAALGFTLAVAPSAMAQNKASLIAEIAAEHNRIRQHPKQVADELRAARAALIQQRTTGGNPDTAADAAKAIDDCIHDLDAIAAKFPTGLPKLTVAAPGNTYAQKCIDTMPSSLHATPMEINSGWKSNGYVGLATAESITSQIGTDKAKAKAVMQGLLIDWGRYNISSGYGHRKFILDYETPSAPPRPGYAKKFKAIGVGISPTGSIRIQYGLN